MKFKTCNYFSYICIAMCAVVWALLTFEAGIAVVIGYYTAILALIAALCVLILVRGHIEMEQDGIAIYYGIRTRRFAYADIRSVWEARFAVMSVNMSFAFPNIAIRMQERGLLGSMNYMVAVADKDAFLKELHKRKPEIEIQKKNKKA